VLQKCFWFIKSFGRCTNTDLEEIGPETWLTETGGIQMLEEDIKYKVLVSWIKQRHSSRKNN